MINELKAAAEEGGFTMTNKLLTVVVIAGLGCGAGYNSGSTPGSTALAVTDGDTDTFTHVYGDILAMQCGPCHTEQDAGGLNMSSRETAYENLVDQASTSGPCSARERTRVVPGDAASSLLWNKVSGVDLCGARMPLGRPPLPQEDIDSIQDWINAGALAN
jgi:hypothetical protein